MTTTWLIIDCNFIAYRAFYSTGNLSFGGDPTGVVYGFLRDVKSFQERFGTPNHTVFAWDHGRGLREDNYPGYKSTRRKKKLTDGEEAALDGMRQQVHKLKTDYLPGMGCKNSFFQKGYEADDVIASVVQNTYGDQRVLVSADKDLYQLLNKNVSIFNPATQRVVTKESFKKEYKVSPHQWPMVKAIAGCTTDDVYGIDGVGEKTAVKYLLGELKKGVKYDAIRGGEKIWTRNLPIVKLPYAGCHDFIPVKDKRDEDGYRAVLERLGITSLFESPSRGHTIGG